MKKTLAIGIVGLGLVALAGGACATEEPSDDDSSAPDDDDGSGTASTGSGETSSGGEDEFCYDLDCNGDMTGKKCFETQAAYCESLCSESNCLAAELCELEC